MIKLFLYCCLVAIVNCWTSYTVTNDGLCHGFPVTKNGVVTIVPSLHSYADSIKVFGGEILYCTAEDSTMYGVDKIKYTVTNTDGTIENGIIYVQLVLTKRYPPNSYDVNVALTNDSNSKFIDVLLHCKDPNGNPDANKITIVSGIATVGIHTFSHLDDPYRSGTKHGIIYVPDQSQEIVYKITSIYSGLESYTSVIYVNSP